MTGNNEMVKVNDTEKALEGELLKVDDNAKQRLQEFTTYIENSPLDEQVKWAKIFDEKTKKYELESVITGNSAERNGEEPVEVTNSDWENIGKVNELMQALYLFPNVSEEKQRAVHDIIYTPITRVEGPLKDVLVNNSNDTDNESGHSDKNIKIEEGEGKEKAD